MVIVAPQAVCSSPGPCTPKFLKGGAQSTPSFGALDRQVWANSESFGEMGSFSRHFRGWQMVTVPPSSEEAEQPREPATPRLYLQQQHLRGKPWGRLRWSHTPGGRLCSSAPHHLPAGQAHSCTTALLTQLVDAAPCQNLALSQAPRLGGNRTWAYRGGHRANPGHRGLPAPLMHRHTGSEPGEARGPGRPQSQPGLPSPRCRGRGESPQPSEVPQEVTTQVSQTGEGTRVARGILRVTAGGVGLGSDPG